MGRSQASSRNHPLPTHIVSSPLEHPPHSPGAWKSEWLWGCTGGTAKPRVAGTGTNEA